MLKGSIPPDDAFLVQQLRAAGAIILAKANLSEWANYRSSRSSSGWSSIGGQTRNPYDPLRSPCGSSSGSAVAVAANLAVDADARLERLAAATDQGERRHRRAKQRHQEQKRANAARGEEVVGRRATKETVAEQPQPEQ